MEALRQLHLIPVSMLKSATTCIPEATVTVLGNAVGHPTQLQEGDRPVTE